MPKPKNTHTHEAAIKNGSGLVVYLMEELTDARLRCVQLKRYVDQATKMVGESTHRDHFFEVAGQLIQGIPETLMKLDKALSASALAASKLDNEELKQELKPEKLQELEQVLDDVRIRYLNRRSTEDTMPITPKSASERLTQLADDAEVFLDRNLIVAGLVQLIGDMDPSTESKTASCQDPTKLLRAVASSLVSSKKVNRVEVLASLRQILACTLVDQVRSEPSSRGFLASLMVESSSGLYTPMALEQMVATLPFEASSREDVMKGFKETNPDMSQEDLEAAADQWEKNKDVVKDKTGDPVDATSEKQASYSYVRAAYPMLADWEPMADREDVKKKFKEQNPSMDQGDLQEVADAWDENKDVIKDKEASYFRGAAVPWKMEGREDSMVKFMVDGGLRNLGSRYGKRGDHYGKQGLSKMIRMGTREMVLMKMRDDGSWESSENVLLSKVDESKLKSWIDQIKNSPTMVEVRNSGK